MSPIGIIHAELKTDASELVKNMLSALFHHE